MTKQNVRPDAQITTFLRNIRRKKIEPLSKLRY